MYKISKKKFDQAVSKLKEKRIIVIGDIILDEYLIGDVNRISPEAPVPVVWVKKENITLGGSGNVIKNLTRIGAISEVFARSGKDEKSKVLEELILRENPDKSDIHLLKSSRVPTTLKTRIIAGHQQICRVDREEIVEISEEEENEIFSDFEKAITLSDGVIISDYDKGYFSKSLIKRIIEVSVKNGKYISVDPQVRHFFLYNQVSILTPNHHEAGKALGRNILSDDEVESAGF
ncbi:MAG: D-glycero-beta-D-manno-heptose-7-phosphate kinase, partial [Leptospira sp.]|nr:D-glycero-beta-D-manno-heptose-7-phosphate kinase [Leptospira sp.]